MSTPAAAAAPPEVAATAATVIAAAPAAAAAATTTAASAAPRCDNCGASVPGRYCGNCGQRLEPPVHSLSHFMTVAMEDVTHADSRLWRTLWALLSKPGYLTREFLSGRRARYLPPVRLYLVLSVVFFLWAAAGSRDPRIVQITTRDDGATAARVTPFTAETISVFSPALPGETAEQRTARICSQMVIEGAPSWMGPFVRGWHSACPRMVADNGRAFEEAYLHNIPRAMFLFLPLLAAAMALLYWRPRHYYVEHLLLLVHNHAFIYLAVLLVWPLTALLGTAGSLMRAAVVLYIPWYAYRSMRVVYGQGRALTVAKLVPLALFYLVSSLMMMTLTIIFSALTL
jgi:hypothetical protein